MVIHLDFDILFNSCNKLSTTGLTTGFNILLYSTSLRATTFLMYFKHKFHVINYTLRCVLGFVLFEK